MPGTSNALSRYLAVLVAFLAVYAAYYVNQQWIPSRIYIAPVRMNLSQPLDVSNDLVSPTNPARADGTFDYERCARLHNYLIQHGWLGNDETLANLPHHNFFQTYGDEADNARDNFAPYFVAFLESITMGGDVSLFYWVAGIPEPSTMFINEELFEENYQNPHRFFTLYFTNPNLGEHPAGLIYDQKLHRATMAMSIEDFDYTQPVHEHEDLWHPLETILSQWIILTRIGKVSASTAESPSEKFECWTWHSYSAAQVDSTVVAFDKLIAAIEALMPPVSLLPIRSGPLLSHAELDAASVPQECFVRDLLTRVRVPRFRRIAPGLLVPLDAAAFAKSQKFAVMNLTSEYGGQIIPPVLLFPASKGETVNFDSDSPYVSLNPFYRLFEDQIPHGDHSTPAGLYSESLDRSDADTAEEGFHLLLPFALRDRWIESGARLSDGGLVGQGSVAELFQHGFKPFGGGIGRAQRLERLLDRWREMVESGVWTVGSDGVDGKIEKFKDGMHWRWREYWISPDWLLAEGIVRHVHG